MKCVFILFSVLLASCGPVLNSNSKSAEPGETRTLAVEGKALSGSDDALFICGDVNEDQEVDVNDLVAMNNCLFSGYCIPTCDADGDRKCDVSDLVAINVGLFTPSSMSCDPEVRDCTHSDGSIGSEYWNGKEFICI